MTTPEAGSPEEQDRGTGGRSPSASLRRFTWTMIVVAVLVAVLAAPTAWVLTEPVWILMA